MKRLIAVALVVAGVAIPVCAQRGGGSHGAAAGHSSSGFASRGGGQPGFSGGVAGHSAPAFHTNFAPAIHSNAVGSPQFRNSPYGGASYRRPGTPAGVRPTRPESGHRFRPPYRYERGYAPVYGAGLAYAGPIGPDCFSFGDCDAYNSAPGPAVAPDVSSDEYVQGPPSYADQGGDADELHADAMQPPPFRSAYQRPAPPLEPQPPVTLVFKDGRPSEQIHNYMLTRTTLYVQDEHHREIAVDDLDLAATEKVNKDAGVAFQLPGVAPRGL